MRHTNDNMKWYALHVRTHDEEFVCRNVDKIMEHSKKPVNYRTLIPKRLLFERRKGRMVKISKPMFPGYVLLETDSIVDLYYEAKRCTQLLGVLRQDDCFYEIPLEQVAPFVYMADDAGTIGYSEVYVGNDLVKVKSGPLCNYNGMIKKIDKRKQRAKVQFQIKNESYLIDLGIHVLQHIDAEDVRCEVYFAQSDY